MKHFWVLFLACLPCWANAQNALSINVLKPAFYFARIKRWQLEPEVGIMLPWASQIGISNDTELVFVNQIRFQWHIALNAGYVFKERQP